MKTMIEYFIFIKDMGLFHVIGISLALWLSLRGTRELTYISLERKIVIHNLRYNDRQAYRWSIGSYHHGGIYFSEPLARRDAIAYIRKPSAMVVP